MHFRLKEGLLLSALAVHGDPYHPLVGRALCGHVAIRQQANDHSPTPVSLRRLGTQLAAHVRMEERELFPLLERVNSTLPGGIYAPAEAPSREGSMPDQMRRAYERVEEASNCVHDAWQKRAGIEQRKAVVKELTEAATALEQELNRWG